MLKSVKLNVMHRLAKNAFWPDGEHVKALGLLLLSFHYHLGSSDSQVAMQSGDQHLQTQNNPTGIQGVRKPWEQSGLD